MHRIDQDLGPVEVLVNNASVNREKMFHKMNREDWDTVVGIDLGSMFNMTRPVIHGMRERGFGRVINQIISECADRAGRADELLRGKSRDSGLHGGAGARRRRENHHRQCRRAGLRQYTMVKQFPHKIMRWRPRRTAPGLGRRRSGAVWH
jgi:NAD(P)-dependent dehydrogenase (short-subunit alcohol dehydrogenase family)